MKTTETKLLTVQVPLDAHEIQLFKSYQPYSHEQTILSWLSDTLNGETLIGFRKDQLIFVCAIHKENGQIVFSPGFEPEKYVEEHGMMKGMWLNYEDSVNHMKIYSFTNATDSFLSRIKAENRVYFDNPLGEEPKAKDFPDSRNEMAFAKAYSLWLEAESKVVKNKVVVLGIKES